jgi:hypothetical protein
MMTRADRDALAIDDRSDVVRVDAVEHERQDARLAARRSDEAETVDGGERLGSVLEQVLLVLANPRKADRLDVVDRHAKRDGPGNIRCAGLELVRQVVPRRFFERHGADIVAAA